MSEVQNHVRDTTAFDVIVVGAGFAGLYQLHRLRELGFSVRLFEAGAQAGGVWYWNRYPGARVDLSPPQYEFSLEAVWRDWYWREKFPSRDELAAYFEHVVNQLDLRADIQFSSRVTSAAFDEATNRWKVVVNGEQRCEARFLVLCTGYASKPYIPHFDNIDRFEGECYHSGLCPESLKFDNKRVAIIGTGASGIQLVQEGAHHAAHLTVFQRTPIYGIPMRQEPLSKQLQEQWKQTYPQQFRERASIGTLIRNTGKSALVVTESERLEALERTWAHGGFEFLATFIDVYTNQQAARLVYDFWRDKVRQRIIDPVLQEKLAPTVPPYPFGVKRPSLEMDYYEAFNQSNVELVDMNEAGIETFTQTGIKTTDGRVFEFDIIVLATGYDAVTGGLTQIDIRGADGQNLAAVWQDGVRTQLGMTAKGFPNMWFIYGPQSPNGACIGPLCAEVQGEWVISCLNHLRTTGVRRFEATQKGQEAWNQVMETVESIFLIAKGNNWQTGSNIPGKKRQLLTHMDYLGYMNACKESERNGYADFALSR